MYKNSELGILSLTTKMQRLCEILRNDARMVYRKYDAKFMNKWYPVILILSKQPPMSLTELASELNYAHPSVIQLVNEIEEEGLIRSSQHKKDNRKRMVSLTIKGEKVMKNIFPFARAMAQALNQITKTENNIIKAINEVEEQLRRENFYSRVDKILEKKTITV
jgi:DNA-binding MarR family transcriptional regulator